MIIYLLKKFFKIIIGDLPEEQKHKFWLDFNDLLKEVIKAAAEGAVKGAVSKNKE